MRTYLDTACWALAILVVALAGVSGWIDESSTATLLVALPAAAFAALSARSCNALLERT